MSSIPCAYLNDVKAAVALAAVKAGCCRDSIKLIFDSIDAVVPTLYCVQVPEVRSKSSAERATSTTKICRRYARRGVCKFGAQCRFEHVCTPVEVTSCSDEEPGHFKAAVKMFDLTVF